MIRSKRALYRIRDRVAVMPFEVGVCIVFNVLGASLWGYAYVQFLHELHWLFAVVPMVYVFTAWLLLGGHSAGAVLNVFTLLVFGGVALLFGDSYHRYGEKCRERRQAMRCK